ncbi:MAG: oligoribonuclease [Gammaproteobacteria bacterium]|nr:oligoribonuclease [Gammaproteobacteria bacterium]
MGTTTSPSAEEQRLIWIDLEMTGLFPESDQIIEIATVVTDGDLNELAQGPMIAIHHGAEIMAAMDEWNTKQHGKSGLTQRVKESAYSVAEAEAETIAFLQQWVPKGVSPMCGNSICQDRRFMARLMPELEAYFHYRNLDVSSIKELTSRWAPEILKGFTKESSHLALDDIRDSIAELKYYRQKVFKI